MRKQELHPRTAVINKTQKNSSKKARSEALLWLAAHFPAAFDNSLRIRPLKIGIMDDILEHAEKAAEVGISKSKLREAVVLFTRRLDYLACIKAGGTRIDLHGNELGVISAEEAAHASLKIKKRVEKSVRNARKTLAEKTLSPTALVSKSSHSSKPKNTFPLPENEDFFPSYPVRSASYHTQSLQTQQTKPASTVTVKHKTTRQFDPNAVARLKEKLGLSKNKDEQKETID